MTVLHLPVNPMSVSSSDSSPRGQLVVITGPSGVGKGTLLRSLLQHHPELFFSISATTRAPRPGEVQGQHYYFVSHEKFEQMLAEGELLESAQFAGNSYGTPRQPVENQIRQGKQVILEIELEGARQVRHSYPQALQVFILPPSLEVLEERIRGRGQDSEAAIAKRLARAQEEIAAADEFDLQIVNDDLATALAQLEAALFPPTQRDAEGNCLDSQPESGSRPNLLEQELEKFG
uniref:Guanylate kinase n=1 Tax=Cyanothece sp. (strain PCC 7425 / ATCC 29141) TaxID=395961 RepID=B8HWL2_CYAP4